MVDFENTQPESLDELPVGAFSIKVFVGAAQLKARARTRFFISMHRHAPFSEYVQMDRSGPNALDMHIAYYIGRLLAADPGASIYIVSNDKDFDPLVEHVKKNGSNCSRVRSIADIVKQQPPARAAPAAKPAAPRAKQSATPKPAASKASAPRAPTPKTPLPKAAAPKAPLPKAPAPKAPAPKAPAPKAAASKASAQRPTPRPPPAPAPARKASAPSDIDAIVGHLRSMRDKPGKRKSLAQTIGAYFKQHGGARGDKAIEQNIEELLRRGLISLSGTKVNYTLGS